jgi:hypothetical protein
MVTLGTAIVRGTPSLPDVACVGQHARNTPPQPSTGAWRRGSPGSRKAPALGYSCPVDGVALASVITSGVLGITTSSIAVWSARQNAKLARETRTQQCLADSYLEVLRIVEREGQWVEASITNWTTAAEKQAAFGRART